MLTSIVVVAEEMCKTLKHAVFCRLACASSPMRFAAGGGKQCRKNFTMLCCIFAASNVAVFKVFSEKFWPRLRNHVENGGCFHYRTLDRFPLYHFITFCSSPTNWWLKFRPITVFNMLNTCATTPLLKKDKRPNIKSRFAWWSVWIIQTSKTWLLN